MLIAVTAGAAPSLEIVQTTRQGDRLVPVEAVRGGTTAGKVDHRLVLDPATTYQTLVGIGGAFTESSAYVLSELSAGQREKVLAAYFSPEGAHYSLTRTQIASSDFSVRSFTYAPVPGDTEMAHFSIEPDRTYLLPMIKAAQAVPGADFNILASPWSAPPWMKTNQTWNGGELMPEHYGTFSRYLVKYLQAYEAEGIPIWGLTPINEPMGNGSNWESMHFTAEEMRTLIADDLGPALRGAGLDTKIWIYDQNRGQAMRDWADVIFGDPRAAQYVTGMAVHWYESTVDIGAESIDYVHHKFPHQQIMHTEGCIDALGDDEPVGDWLEDDWYWRPVATDWGLPWAPEDQKKDHPPYRAFYRYVRDLIGGFNHNFVGWIDWNLLLNYRGGPNHARNFCLAPVLIDSGHDEAYFTPLYYAMAHFSKYLRPGAQRIGLTGQNDEDFWATAFRNPDGSIALVVFNPTEVDASYEVVVAGTTHRINIPGQALQTLVLR